jgi:hypothetical protein
MQACNESIGDVTILLPASDIEIATSFTVKHPVHFKGRPGTCMMFRNTHLTIDFGENVQKYSLEDTKGLSPYVTFSEVQFIFNIDLRKVSQTIQEMKEEKPINLTKDDEECPETAARLKRRRAVEENARRLSQDILINIDGTRSHMPFILVECGTRAKFVDCTIRCVKFYPKEVIRDN